MNPWCWLTYRGYHLAPAGITPAEGAVSVVAGTVWLDGTHGWTHAIPSAYIRHDGMDEKLLDHYLAYYST